MSDNVLRKASLPSLPLEILFAIWVELTPGELLELSRLAKAFRPLASKSTAWIWKAACENEPAYPRRPESYSPIYWAHLLYSGFCRECAAPAKPDFALGVVLCKTCDQQLTLTTRLPSTLNRLVLTRKTDRNQVVVLKEDIEYVQAKRSNLDSWDEFVEERQALVRDRFIGLATAASWYGVVIKTRNAEEEEEEEYNDDDDEEGLPTGVIECT